MPNILESTLNFHDEEKALNLLTKKYAVSVYRDRAYRGFESFTSANCFCIYASNPNEVCHIEPCRYIREPDQLIERLKNEMKISNFLAGGWLSPAKLDVTSLWMDQDNVPELIARGFGAKHACSWQLIEFARAETLISSRPTGWGTVDKIVKSFGLEIPLHG